MLSSSKCYYTACGEAESLFRNSNKIHKLREQSSAGEWHCVKSVQIRSYSWSVFSCILTEYGDLRSKSYSVRIQDRIIRTRNKSVFGHFSRSMANSTREKSSKMSANCGAPCRFDSDISHLGCILHGNSQLVFHEYQT